MSCLKEPRPASQPATQTRTYQPISERDLGPPANQRRASDRTNSFWANRRPQEDRRTHFEVKIIAESVMFAQRRKQLCLHKARGVDSLGPPHPGRHPRGQPPRPLAARPPLPRRRSGPQGIGRAVPPLRPAPDPPPRRSTPPPRALGPSAARATARPPGVIRFRCIRHGLACVPCCLTPPSHTPFTPPKPRPLTAHHALPTPLTSLRPSHSQPPRGSPRGTRTPFAQLLPL
nr:serine/arginine repetitive matrix protein 1-like [Penaeus vannamei]